MMEELELTSDSQPYRPTTPIALELYGHFARGGSAAEGVRLVEALERHALAITSTSKLTAKKSVERGLRLSPDWQPSPPDISFALDRGLPPERISTEAEKFRNYWVAKSGAGACIKLLAAEPLVEFSAEHRARMASKLRALAITLQDVCG